MSSTLVSQLGSRIAEQARLCSIDGISAPACFSTLAEEYRCLRERVAISDQGHFGKFHVSGSQAVDLLSYVNLPDIARLPIGKTASSFMLTEAGGVFCECYIVSAGDSYLLLTEGRERTEVADYLREHAGSFDVSIKDVSEDLGMLQLDGPFAWEVLKDLIGVKILGLRYLETLDNQRIGNCTTQIIRSGKTGEFGYSLIVDKGHVVELWDTLLTAGERYQMLPVGFEALDLVRLENRFPNLRIDCAKVANPLEMNCRVMFDREKDDHLGRSAIESVMQTGPARRIVGFTAKDDSQDVPQLGDEVRLAGQVIGEVVNAGFSFMLNKTVGLALVDNDVAFVGLEYSVGDRSVATTSAPFVDNKSLSIRPQEHSFHSKG